ncbi:MAG TPA: hypothetical protein VM142_01920 [Acidimicrobiales bacterium]|nr:hypothetical protein [Acidimicrobiales bacterium]
MAIILREGFELSDDDEVVIHMGAGAHTDVVRALCGTTTTTPA